MRIYLFIRWVAWDLWWSGQFISLPLSAWGLQIVWDRTTLLSLSNLNRVLKLSSSLWVASLPIYFPGRKQQEPLCGQPPGGCVSSTHQGLSRCARWGEPAVPSVSFCTSGIVPCWEDLLRFFMPAEIKVVLKDCHAALVSYVLLCGCLNLVTEFEWLQFDCW